MGKDIETKVWDVAVIGGGPAGMIAAGRAAESGASVILLEKNASLGKKLLITGGGRCNVTNAEFDDRVLLSKYGEGGKYLSSPFATWNAKKSIEFFESRNMPTKIEAEKRVFPVSDKARSVYEVLIEYMKAGNVT
ncbi:MAG: NAD(P)/FAD-dependent oxidoreductase, partial [Minisyncoccia bacterium]